MSTGRERSEDLAWRLAVPETLFADYAMRQTLIDWYPAFIIVTMTLALMFWHDISGLVALTLIALGLVVIRLDKNTNPEWG